MSEVDSRCGSGGAGTVKNSAKVVSKEFRGREFFQPRGDWAASALATGLLLRSLLKGLPPLIALPLLHPLRLPHFPFCWRKIKRKRKRERSEHIRISAVG
jgi:hypothetical protein